MKKTHMKNKILLIAVFMVAGLMGSFMHLKTAEASSAVIPNYIYAVYTGGTVVVGEDIDLDTLKVYAVYPTGAVDTVTNYTLSDYTITSSGSNLITVVYMGRSYSFYVTGKSISSITAIYSGGSVHVGDSVNTRYLRVYMTYTDGTIQVTKDYTITNPVITTIGTNRIQITYNSKSTTINVYGIASKSVRQLYATYSGSGVMEGSEINKEDIYVTALYTDGTSGMVSNYTMSESTAQIIGDNVIRITYLGISTTVTIIGIEKTISSIIAEYNGETVEVGGYVRLKNVTVMAVYADGSKEEVTDFSLPNPEIYYVGTHIKTVYYQGFTDTIIVTGVEEKEPSYDNAAEFSATDGYMEINGQLAVPDYADPDEINFESVYASARLDRLMLRVARGEFYIAFEIDFIGEIEDDFPIEMTLEVPQGYNAENCSLYFTPNKRSVIALMNTEVDEENNTLVCDVYNPGTYVLVYSYE